MAEDGNPIVNMGVAFYWSDAPDPPDPPTEVYAHDWYPNFVHGPTNENGDVGPGMGRGAWIDDPAVGGPHAVWVRDLNIPSDICERLGMLPGTPHDHLDQKFKLMTAGEEPVEGDPVAQIRTKAQEIIDLTYDLGPAISQINVVYKNGTVESFVRAASGSLSRVWGKITALVSK